jgi:hypothetical protein
MWLPRPSVSGETACSAVMNMGERVLYKMASNYEYRESRIGDRHTLLRGICEFLPAHSVYLDRLRRNSLNGVWTYSSLAVVSFVKICGVNAMLDLPNYLPTYLSFFLSVRPSTYLPTYLAIYLPVYVSVCQSI